MCNDLENRWFPPPPSPSMPLKLWAWPISKGTKWWNTRMMSHSLWQNKYMCWKEIEVILLFFSLKQMLKVCETASLHILTAWFRHRALHGTSGHSKNLGIEGNWIQTGPMEFMVWRQHVKFSRAGCHSYQDACWVYWVLEKRDSNRKNDSNLGRQEILVPFSPSGLTGKFSLCFLCDILPSL